MRGREFDAIGNFDLFAILRQGVRRNAELELISKWIAGEGRQLIALLPTPGCDLLVMWRRSSANSEAAAGFQRIFEVARRIYALQRDANFLEIRFTFSRCRFLPSAVELSIK